MKIITTAVLSVGGMLLAQDPQTVIKQRVETKMKGELTQTFNILTSEMVGGNLVKGAPYSAQAVTESTQTLADGNRIVRRTSSQLYRDSSGRERREQSLREIGNFTTQDDSQQTIFISDPVAGVNYTLETQSKTARKNTAPSGLAEKRLAESKAVMAGAGGRGGFHVTTDTRETGPGEAGVMVHGSEHVVMTYTTRGDHTETSQAKKEDLGTMVIEGVAAEGTRITMTIPAGQIGNEKPIVTSHERWYSPELKITVMTKNSDPRNGETVYRLTNINRAEPSATLFEVPSDYTIRTDKTFFFDMPAKHEEQQ